jgi:hypothetical protein
MTKMESYIEEAIALIKGDDAKALATKNWRKSVSAFKVQLAAMEGNLISKEDKVETAKEVLKKALYNNGILIKDEEGNIFIQQIINCQNNVEQAEKELSAHKKTIAFLEEQYAKLKA